MKNYLQLLKYTRPYAMPMFIAILFMFIFAATNGLLAYILGPAMKVLFMPGSGETLKVLPFDIFKFDSESIKYQIPVFIIVVSLLKGISSFGNTYLMGYVGQMVVKDLRRMVYDHILKLPVDYYVKTPSGDITARIISDISMLQQLTTEIFVATFKHVATIIVLLVVVIKMDYKLASITLVLYPIIIYPLAKLGKKLKRISHKGQESIGALISFVNEAVQGVRIVKAFTMEKYEVDKFDNENKNYTKQRLKTIKVKALATPFMETIGAFGFAATIWYAIIRISEGTLKPEDFISFLAALGLLYQPIKSLNGVHLNIMQNMAGVERVFYVLGLEKELSEKEEDKDKLRELKDGIEFRKVTFNYGDENVLNNFNLKVNKGETLAIVGSSGAGKTTLVNLIPRFYEITDGEILIDSKDIKDINIASIRDNIAMISQHIVLFNDTVKNNISYGKESSLEYVEKIARLANAHEFIEKLPQGYDTVIGESGVKLSGGQRQRLSIARAMLKNAPILIMDEATSALDTESEKLVQEGIENLMKDRTVFVIAHRLSTITSADRIIVLKKGEVVEEGSHRELIDKKGEYSRLYDMQFKD